MGFHFVLPLPLTSFFCYHSASLNCLLFLDTWFTTDREGDRGLTEEQPFPYFKKIGGCEWAAGRKVDAERLKGFFAGWAVYRSEVLAGMPWYFNRKSNIKQHRKAVL